jgi:serine/threonine protein kinase
MDTAHTSACPNCFGDLTSTPCPHCGWQPNVDNPPPALALGTLLDGRYRIGRVLGHGGFGITYLARDENLHLRLAIKEYLPRDCATRAPDGVSLAIYSGQAGEQFAYGLNRFLDEARALARFDQHPGIVTVKSFFRAHGTGYCVMDYVEGMTLKQYLERQPDGRIPVEQAWRLLQPVMDALRAVHKEGLLHRDVAPDNIYITQDGRIKLLDFGAARFAAGEHSRSLSIILKPGYAPEEQYRTRGKQGPWTDVYGLAATLYRTITGTAPPEALDRLDEDEVVLPSKLGVPMTSAQESVLINALAVRAAERYSSIMTLQERWHEAETQGRQPLEQHAFPESPSPLFKLQSRTPIGHLVEAPIENRHNNRHAGAQSRSITKLGRFLLLILIIVGLGYSFFLFRDLPSDKASFPTSANTETRPDVVNGATGIDASDSIADKLEEQRTIESEARKLLAIEKADRQNEIAGFENYFIDRLAGRDLISNSDGISLLSEFLRFTATIEADETWRWHGLDRDREDIEADGRQRITERLLTLVDTYLDNQDIKSAQNILNEPGWVAPTDAAFVARYERLISLQKQLGWQDQVANFLSKFYGKYDLQKKCWLTAGDGRVSEDGTYCMTVHRSDRISTNTADRLYVLVVGESDSSSTIVPGLVGFFILEDGGDRLNLIASAPKIEIGSRGKPPVDWRLERIGPSDYWGWVAISRFSQMGVTYRTYQIFAPYGKGFREVGKINEHYDDEGSDQSGGTTEINAEMKIDSTRDDSRVFPLLISVSGNEKGRVLKERKWVIPFNYEKWLYVPPKESYLGDDHYDWKNQVIALGD